MQCLKFLYQHFKQAYRWATHYPMTNLLVILSAILGLTACEPTNEPLSDLQKIQQRGVLRVGTLNNQLSYFIGPNGPTGLDYELSLAFAKELGVQLEIKPIFHSNELFSALDDQSVDLIAAGLHQDMSKMKDYNSGPAYYYANQVLVYKVDQWKPKDLKDLISHKKEIIVSKGSEYASTLKKIAKSNPDLKWQVDEQIDTGDLLIQLSKGEGDIEFTVVDSTSLFNYQRLYPNLATAFELTDEQPIVWYTRQSDNDNLDALILEFFNQQHQSGELANLEEKYFGHMDVFNYVDTRIFIESISKNLPKYKPLFQKYSAEFDWRLIAAIAYQESHWNPQAISATGVRGIMMLTNATAKSVNVTNRLDPDQSIRGGVTYLRRLMKRIPESIPEHEKIWFALASYNLGYGHVIDARRLAEMDGKNPNLWADVKEQLPKLTQPRYYNKTRYGYARGYEGLNYVEKIRSYYQTIIGYEQEQEPPEPENEPEITVNEQGFQVVPQVILPQATAPQAIGPKDTDLEAIDSKAIDSGKVAPKSIASESDTLEDSSKENNLKENNSEKDSPKEDGSKEISKKE